MKATYSLDEETVQVLERLARRLAVSKSEVLRRAIHDLARSDLAPGDTEVAALDELQRKLGLTMRDAEEWESQVRSERLVSGRG